jgi:hypothetical protein
VQEFLGGGGVLSGRGRRRKDELKSAPTNSTIGPQNTTCLSHKLKINFPNLSKIFKRLSYIDLCLTDLGNSLEMYLV